MPFLPGFNLELLLNKSPNTLKDSIKAFYNFDGIEFDVRLTKDNIPIVIHDHMLNIHNSNIIVLPAIRIL